MPQRRFPLPILHYLSEWTNAKRTPRLRLLNICWGGKGATKPGVIIMDAI